jgi:hypothetical protein
LRSGFRQPSSHARRGGGHSASEARKALVHAALMRLQPCPVNKRDHEGNKKGGPRTALSKIFD